MHEQTNCPHCGRLNNRHATTDPSEPSEGDFSMCWKCGGVAVFTEDGVRLPTTEEEAEISQEPMIKKFRYAIAESIVPSEAVRMVKESE